MSIIQHKLHSFKCNWFVYEKNKRNKVKIQIIVDCPSLKLVVERAYTPKIKIQYAAPFTKSELLDRLMV